MILKVLFLSLFAISSYAQMPYLPERSMRFPHESESFRFRSLEEVNAGVKSGIDPKASTEILKSQFEKVLKVLNTPKPSCENEKAKDYALALHVAGRFDECAAYARACSQNSKMKSSKVIAIGAACEATRFQYEKADALYEQAIDPKFSGSSDFAEVVYDYASYALYGIHEDRVDRILAQAKVWSDEERKMFKNLLYRVGDIEITNSTQADVDQFLKSQIQKQTGSFQALLKSLKIRIAYTDYKYTDALTDLKNEGASLQNPLLWYDLLHSILYYGLDKDFRKSRDAYLAYDRFANPWMKFPVENNTYNYTEIYDQVCKAQLMQGSDQSAFSDFKNRIRKGELTADQALETAATWVDRFPEKADVLTTFGGLLALTGQHDQAFATYWKAHKLCPHYHRANWGLTLEKRYYRYSRMHDYKKREAQIEEDLSQRVIPAEISEYILNWNSLSFEVQRRVAYGARIWLPFMKSLKDVNSYTYIKYAFDLLSESPGREDLRDVRIGGPSYPNDNRLWDDVRGVGGTFVVADLSEVFQSVQGDYNLLGHEMAHQVHTYFESYHRPSAVCIEKFFRKAQTENGFPDGYSAYNHYEHFAQGATYYMIPSDSPKRFGLNRAWLENNNPLQLQFIKSIEDSKGELSKIMCPL